MKNFLSNLRYLNWWSITSVLFLITMVIILAEPALHDKWAWAAGVVSIVSAIFALGDSNSTTPPPDSKRRLLHEEAEARRATRKKP